MMAATLVLSGMFSLAMFLLTYQGTLADMLPVTTDNLLSHLENGFSERRSYEQPAQKDKARKYIKDFLENLASKYSTSVIEQKYQFKAPFLAESCDSSTCPGANYVWVLPGSRYGTPQDKVLLVGAHYDTVPHSPGVDDNGSGMTAMLESARILSQSDLSCDRLNSVVFAAFDWEEFGDWYGSKMFVDQIQSVTENLQVAENFHGAIILDTIMNWNSSENSQVFPSGYDMAFPEIHEKEKNRGFQGDFLSLLQRGDDEELGNGLAAVWGELADQKYGILNVQLPAAASGKISSWPLQMRYAFGDFLRSDHSNFWNYTTSDGKGLKAVFVADTANLRGMMMDCYHSPCDALDKITPESLEFLAKGTEMVVRYSIQQTTEKTAAECWGEPQENWKADVSGAPGLIGTFCLLTATLGVLMTI